MESFVSEESRKPIHIRDNLKANDHCGNVNELEPFQAANIFGYFLIHTCMHEIVKFNESK